LSGSSGRQSAGEAAARTSGILGCLAADAVAANAGATAEAGTAIDATKKISAHGIKNLTLRDMHEVLHRTLGTCLAEDECAGF
jgi:hypothetical protein